MKVSIVGRAGTTARLRPNDEYTEAILLKKGQFISSASCGLQIKKGIIVPVVVPQVRGTAIFCGMLVFYPGKRYNKLL